MGFHIRRPSGRAVVGNRECENMVEYNYDMELIEKNLDDLKQLVDEEILIIAEEWKSLDSKVFALAMALATLEDRLDRMDKMITGIRDVLHRGGAI